MADLENILEIAVWSKVGFSLQSNYWPVAMPSWSLVERWCHMAGSHLSGFIAVGSENWQDNAICRAHGAGSNPAYLTYVNSSLHLNSSVLLQTVLICTLQTESRNCFQTFQMELFPKKKKKPKKSLCPSQPSHPYDCRNPVVFNRELSFEVWLCNTGGKPSLPIIIL